MLRAVPKKPKTDENYEYKFEGMWNKDTLVCFNILLRKTTKHVSQEANLLPELTTWPVSSESLMGLSARACACPFRLI
jgi:hypothetical protein